MIVTALRVALLGCEQLCPEVNVEVALARLEPGRELSLAVAGNTWIEVFQEPIGQLVLGRLKILVFDPVKEELQQWTPESPTERPSSDS